MSTRAPENTADLVDALVRWGHRLIPDPERAERLAVDLRAHGAARDSVEQVTEESLRELEQVCHRTARHLTLELHPPAEPDRDVAGWPAVPPEAVSRRAGFVRGVRRLDGGCGMLRIDGFDEVADAGRVPDGGLRGTGWDQRTDRRPQA